MAWKIKNQKLRPRALNLIGYNAISLSAFNSPDGGDCAILLDEEMECPEVVEALKRGHITAEKLPAKDEEDPDLGA